MALPELPSFNAADDRVIAAGQLDGTVWHYTTGAGLAGLVEGRVLWASAMAFMNDVDEVHTGLEVFKKLLATDPSAVDERIRGDFDAMVRDALTIDPYRRYIACASQQPDSLTMWRNYTAEVGYAVALDGTKPFLMRRQRQFTESMIAALGIHDDNSKQRLRDDSDAGSPEFAWTPVVYKPEAQHKAAWALLHDIEAAAVARLEGRHIEKHELYAMLDAAMAVPTFKNPAFEDEAETRIVCNAGAHVDRMYLKHRPGKYGMIPYVELGLPIDPRQELVDGPEQMGELPIKGVIIGPTRYQDAACMGVRALLRSHGYNESIPVIASRIPFRS